MDDNLEQNDLTPNEPKNEVEENSEIPPEVFEKLPPQLREVVKRVSITQAMGPFPMQHPLEKVTTSEHLTKIIDNADKDSERDYKDRSQSRLFNLLVIVVVAIVIILLSYLLKSDPELFKSTILPIISAIVGAIGGYGYGVNKVKNSD